MNPTAALGALVLISCRASMSPAPEAARCQPSVPRTAQHPIATRPASLAGYYELILVQTQPTGGLTTSGRLQLARPDSSSRAEAVGGPSPHLVGRLELDRDSAGIIHAVLTGEHLRLGHPAHGHSVQSLTITAVAPEGLWGWWRSDRGIAVVTEPGTGRVLPDPAGYFCALRRGGGR